MGTVHPVIYGMRGWIAFVAFIEISNALRCFFDEKEFLQKSIFSADLEPDETVTGITVRIMGRYCFLNALILIHCAFFIHHIPMIVLTICSLTMTICLYGTEAFYYYTAPLSFQVVFPIFISFITIICLCIAPCFMAEEERGKSKALLNIKSYEGKGELDEKSVNVNKMLIKQKQAKQIFGTLQAKLNKKNQ